MIAGSEQATCAIFGNDIKLRCWGGYNYGQNLRGTTRNIGGGGYAELKMTQVNYVLMYKAPLAVPIEIKSAKYSFCILFRRREPHREVANAGYIQCWGYDSRRFLLGRNPYSGTHQGDDSNELFWGGAYVDLGSTVNSQPVQVTMGWYHTCALLVNKEARCWGYNYHGQLGIGSRTSMGYRYPYGGTSRRRRRSSSPFLRGTAVSSMANIQFKNDGAKPIYITAGGYHTCALFDNQKVRCWGHNDVGQCGLNLGPSSAYQYIGSVNWHMTWLSYVTFADTSRIVDIAAGADHSCALFANGKVRCWGGNMYGQIGVNTADAYYGLSPGAQSTTALDFIPFSDGQPAVSIHAGSYITCALFEFSNAELKSRCWGRAASNALGTGDNLWNYGRDKSTEALQYIDFILGPSSRGNFFRIDPEGGWATGGTKVYIRGPHRYLAENVVVQLTDTANGLSAIRTTTFEHTEEISFIAPSWGLGTRDKASVTLALSSNGFSFKETHRKFHYYKVPVFKPSIQSGKYTGGTKVSIANVTDLFEIQPPATCKFGPNPRQIAKAIYDVNTGTFECTSPSGMTHPLGSSSLSLSMNGLDYLDFPWMFHNIGSMVPKPDKGPISGDTVLTLEHANMVDTGDRILGEWRTSALTLQAVGTFVPAVGSKPAYIQIRTPAISPQQADALFLPLTFEFFVSVNDGVDWLACGTYMYYRDPQVLGVTPNMAPTQGGTRVTVVGLHLQDLPGITFKFNNATHNVYSTASYDSLTKELVADSPYIAGGGIGVIEISFNGQQYTNDKIPFSFTQIKDLNPNGGPIAGGTAVAVIGVGFQFSTTINCKWGAAGVTVGVYVSSSQLTCTSPTTTAAQVVNLEVQTNAIDYTDDRVTFTFYDPPKIDAISPDRGPAALGVSLSTTLTGSGFIDLDPARGIACQIGATITTGKIVVDEDDPTIITATCSVVNSVGVVPVYFAMNRVDFIATGFTWTYFDIFGLSPDKGPTVGGTEIAVSGSGFGVIPGKQAVCRFGNTPVNAIVSSSAQVVCVSPSGTSGKVVVEFSSDGDTFTLGGIEYEFYTAPTVTKVTPSSVAANGGTLITLQGSYFRNDVVNTYCKFGRAAVPAISYEPDPRLDQGFNIPEADRVHTVHCLSPASSNPRVPSEISFNGGKHYTENGILTSFFESTSASPANGPVTGGTVVTVTGSGFFEDFKATTLCKFGPYDPVPGTILDDRRVECVSPRSNGTNEAIQVRMTTNGGQQYTQSFAAFDYYVVPTISSYAPATGPAFSTQTLVVTIVGTDFQDTTGLSCRFGQIDSPKTSFVSDTSVECEAPVGTGVVPLRVSLNQKDYHDIGDFVYFAVLSVSPQYGPRTGGTIISVSGRGFTPSTGLKCRIMGLEVPAVFVHDALLTCTTPQFVGNSTRRLLEYEHPDTPRHPRAHALLSALTGSAPSMPSVPSVIPSTPSLLPARGMVPTLRVLQTNTTTSNTTNSTGPPPPPPPPPASRAHLSESYISVTTNGVFYSTAQSNDGKFHYYDNPQIDSIYPTQGQTAGTDLIDIRGKRFTDSALLGCRFGGAESNPVPATFITDTHITCKSSLHVLGTVTVYVTENYQQFYAGPSYLYTECPPGQYAQDFKIPCRPCANGTYAALVGSSRCLPCGQNQYTVNIGSSNCTTCPDNTDILGDNRDSRKECKCKKGFYHPQYISGEPCDNCPDGGSCAGGIEIPLARPGYWSTPDNPILFMECDLPEACIGGPPHSCRRGYEGRLCADCQDGFYKLNGLCEVCPELAVWIIILFVIFASIICAMLVKMVGKNASAYGATVGIATYYFQVLAMLNKMDMQWPYVIRRVIEILTAPFTWNLDILAMECSFPVTYKSKWLIFLLLPFMFIWVFALFYLLKKIELWYQRRKKLLSPSFFSKQRETIPLNLDIYAARESDDDFSENDAAFEADDGGFSIHSSSEADDGGYDIDSEEGPDTVVAEQRQGAYVRKVKMTSNRHKYEDPIALSATETEEEAERRIEDNALLSFKNRLINAYLLLLSLVYLVMVSTALELFDCTVRKDGVATLDVFPALECYQTWWWIFMPIGIISVLIYGVCLPSFYAFLVVHNRHRLATPIFIERYGSIYSEYKLTWAYWESITMAHKLMMALPLLYLTVYPDFQIVSFLCVLFLGLTINIMVRPFYVERYNNLQNALRWCSCLMLLCGMIFRSGDFPHWSVEYVVIGTAFVLIGISCFGVFIVIVGDIVATQIALRRNVEARQMECLHTVMHTHGKTEIMMWLGSHRRGGINYQLTLCEILGQIADDYNQHRDAHGFTFVDMAPIDHFIDMYTGNSFMTPVVPFVRAWLLTRISAVQADSEFATDAMESFQNFVSTFSEFTNFIRLLHAKRIPLPPESKRDAAGGMFRALPADDEFADRAIDQELHDNPAIAEEAMGVIRVLFADLLSQKMRIAVWKQLEQGNESALTYLTRAVCNLPDMVNSRLGAEHFFRSTYLFKQAAMAEVDDMINDQPLLPFLHIFYEDSFSDYAMYELAKQISSLSNEDTDYIDFQQNRRSAMHLLHEVFVLSRKPSGSYDTHAAITNIPPRAEADMMKAAWGGVTNFFSSFTRSIRDVLDDDPEFWTPEMEEEAQRRREQMLEEQEEEILREALREKTWVDHTKKQAAEATQQGVEVVTTGIGTGWDWLSSKVFGSSATNAENAGSSADAGPSGESSDPSDPLAPADVSIDMPGLATDAAPEPAPEPSAPPLAEDEATFDEGTLDGGTLDDHTLDEGTLDEGTLDDGTLGDEGTM
eukprot:TRINITY_DN4759_c0_g1_i1.p1 TRINITY_DN4759_c0_g1~~TRINITY_DN4759_c0_g1_i1.p1  ORF type:complete len:2765 (+),score=608.45 TRINITY_DN4759_c0_g1_i1:633-8927(+)